MVFSIELINKNSKKFRFQEGECASARYALNSKLLKQSLPDAPAEDAIIINLGREKSSSFPFQLRKTTVDASDGTHTSTVKTVQEKVDYLIGTFITDGIEDLYTLNIYTSAANITALKGIVENFSLSFTAEKPSSLPGEFSIQLGGAKQT